MNDSSNNNNNSEPHDVISFTKSMDSWLETTLFLSYVIPLILFTLISNSLVIYLLSTHPPLKNPSNLYLLSLAVTDLACAIFVMPVACFYSVVGVWRLGTAVCQIWNFFIYSLTSTSILHMCAIAVDRYLAITRPLAYGMNRSNRRTVAVVGMVWTGIFLLQSPPFIYDWDGKWPEVYGEATQCAVPQEYSHYFAVTSLFCFYLPLLIILGVYVKLYLINRDRLRKKIEKAENRVEMASAVASSAIGAANKNGGDAIDATHEVAATAASGVDIETVEVAGHNSSNISSKPSVALVKGSKRRMFLFRPATEFDVQLGGQSSKASSSRCLNCQAALPKRAKLNTCCQICSSPNDLILAAERSRLQILMHRERRSMLVTSLILCTFVLCYMPVVTTFVVMSVFPTLEVNRWVVLVVTWLAYTNSACNPVIYTLFNKDFKDAVVKLIC